MLARISYQSDNQVILGSRNWNQEGKGADGAGVSDLWEWKRVTCRMIGLMGLSTRSGPLLIV